MEGVVSMINELDTLPSNNQSERVGCHAVGVKCYASTGENDAQASQKEAAEHVPELESDEYDIDADFDNGLERLLKMLNLDDEGDDGQNYGADDTVKAGLNCDSTIPQKLDTKDAGADEEEEWSDDEEIGFNFMELSDEEDFNAKAYWKRHVDDPAEEFARTMIDEDEVRRKAALAKYSDGFVSLTREFVANALKEPPPALNQDWAFGGGPSRMPEIPSRFRWFLDMGS